jgi:hypothetical protein
MRFIIPLFDVFVYDAQIPEHILYRQTSSEENVFCQEVEGR